mgnify:CR=1 FL=1
MRRINQDKAKRLIHNTNGKVFSVCFIKKDGSEREMNCRLGVKKHLKGGKLRYNPADYDLLTVFDMQKRDYRMIQLKSLCWVTVGGKSFIVDHFSRSK